jgi:hypothetical protein
MVEQIKKKLGDNIILTNQNAKNIVKTLNNIKDSIDPKIIDLSTPDTEGNRLRVFKNGKYYDTFKSTNYTTLINTEDSDLRDFYESSKYTEQDGKIRFGIDANKYIGMKNLDEKETDNVGAILNKRPDAVYDPDDPANPVTIDRIQLRLENCQFLEMLYLVKHEELMKTFAFTLNLFDKYKYSIKLLLFVLKNLVRKDLPSGTGAIPNIRLPKKLIPNIVKLLADQKQVQDVITLMKTNLDETKNIDIQADGTEIPRALVDGVKALSDLSTDQRYENPPIGPSEEKSNHDLKNITSPTKPHVFESAPGGPI